MIAKQTKSLASALALGLLLSSSALALVIEDGNSAALGHDDAGAAAYVGQVGGGSGVYLGGGMVMTAGHVGAGDFTIAGVTLPNISGTPNRLQSVAGSTYDLLLFQVDTSVSDAAILDSTLNISLSPMVAGESLLLAGYGLGREDDALIGQDGQAFGYLWNGERDHRYGLSEVTRAEGDLLHYGNTVTPYLTTAFTSDAGSTQATTGDSGGAAFSYNATSGEYELAGIVVGISGREGHSRYGQETRIADLSQVLAGGNAAGSVPEPSGVLYAGIALSLALLRRRR